VKFPDFFFYFLTWRDQFRDGIRDGLTPPGVIALEENRISSSSYFAVIEFSPQRGKEEEKQSRLCGLG
jgi:hypothetical protein